MGSTDNFINDLERVYKYIDDSNYNSALNLSFDILSKYSDSISILNIISRIYQHMNEYCLSIKYATDAIDKYNLLSIDEKIAYEQELKHSYFSLWYSQSELSQYQDALATVKTARELFDNRNWWNDLIIDSLIDLGRFDEAEFIYGIGGCQHKCALYSIGFSLAYRKSYKIASEYFKRYYLYCTGTQRVDILLLYVECLFLAEEYLLVYMICDYWYENINKRNVKKKLALFLIVSMQRMRNDQAITQRDASVLIEEMKINNKYIMKVNFYFINNREFVEDYWLENLE